jgi:hypothetical protein
VWHLEYIAEVSPPEPSEPSSPASVSEQESNVQERAEFEEKRKQSAFQGQWISPSHTHHDDFLPAAQRHIGTVAKKMLWYEQLSFLELSSLAILLDQSRTPLS